MEFSISRNNRPRSWRFARGLAPVLLLAVTTASVLQSEEGAFDPASVQSRACRTGVFLCGYSPLSGDELELIEPADSTYVRPRGMPARLDLTGYLPPVGNQGQQNSCLGWALGYGLKSYYEQAARQWGYDAPSRGGRGLHVFSPSFIYNQINGGEDRGATPRDAFALLTRQGASPWALMPYREDDFQAPPGPEARSQALAFRAEDYRKLPCSDVNAIKAELYRGNPVLIGIRAHLNFYNLGEKVWENHEGRFFGGHAVLIAGYDDARRSALGYTGAYRIYNSFGPKWGQEGLGWLAYDFMPQACLGAFVLHESQINGLPSGTKERGEGQELTPAPRGLRVSRGAFPDRVELLWESVPGAIGYRVEREEREGFETIAQVDVPAFRDTAVQPRVTYGYRIVTIGPDNESEPNVPARGYARTWRGEDGPGPVWNLRAERAPNFVQLDWERAQNAATHEVARWDEAKKTWRTLFTQGLSRYRDRTPTRNQVHFYRVRGLERGVPGDWSGIVAVRLAGRNVAPGAVRDLNATRGRFPDRIELSWSPVPDASRYVIHRAAPAGGVKEFTSPRAVFADTTTEVKSGENFQYRVFAESEGAIGRPGGPVIGRAAAPGLQRGTLTAAPRVRILREQETKRIILRWEPVSGASEYRVYRRTGFAGEYTVIGTIAQPGVSFVAPLIGGPGTLYLYTVRARTAAGQESEPSDPVSALVPPGVRARGNEAEPFNAGLREFAGQWSAFDFERGASRPLELFVATSGRDFRVSILSEGRPLARFNGEYLARDRVLATRDFRMELAEARAGSMAASAQVFFRVPGVAPGGKEIVFVRDVR